MQAVSGRTPAQPALGFTRDGKSLGLRRGPSAGEAVSATLEKVVAAT